jgi:hypothetical protein
MLSLVDCEVSSILIPIKAIIFIFKGNALVTLKLFLLTRLVSAESGRKYPWENRPHLKVVPILYHRVTWRSARQVMVF